MANTSFKFTFPVLKAESREDGLYILGFASGPEVDTDDERIAPEAIERFAKQIEERQAMGDPLPYRDAHAPDGVLRDLGVLTKAWINEHFHLGVEVRLDSDNPASVYLFNQVSKGKQFGMSVSGTVLDWASEFVAELGRSIRTFKHVVLDEISNTTRPAWYPSLGTVLAKSVSDADDGAATMGESTSMDDEELHSGEDAVEESVAVTEPVEGDGTEAQSEGADDAGAAADDDVEKAGRSISAANRERLGALYHDMTETLVALGVIESDAVEVEPDKSAQDSDEAETLAKAVDEAVKAAVAAQVAENEELITLVAEATERIEALENAPRTQLPGAITDAATKSAEEEFRAEFDKASPSEKLRIALAGMHGTGVAN